MEKIFIRLTTVPNLMGLEGTQMFDTDEFKLWKRKYQDAKEFKGDRDAWDKYKEEAAKNPTFARIATATLGMWSTPHTGYIKMFTGDEKAILQKIKNLLQHEAKNATLVTYNKAFTLPFLTTRMIKNGVDFTDLPAQIRHYGVKPWDLKKTLCYQDYFKGAGWFVQSFRELSHNFNMDSDFMTAEDVSFCLLQGDCQEEVFTDNVKYIHNMMNIDRIVDGKKPIQMEPIDGANGLSGFKIMEQELIDEVETPVPAIEKTYRTGQVDPELVEKADSRETAEVINAAVHANGTPVGDPQLQYMNSRLNDYNGLLDTLTNEDKGKLKKVRVNKLIKAYKEADPEVRESVIRTVQYFMTKPSKTKAEKDAFEILKKELNNEEV